MYTALAQGIIVNAKATAAITRGRAVKLGSTDAETLKVTQSGAGEEFDGVALEDAAAAGDTIPVLLIGVCKMTAGAAVAIGAYIKADANGKAVTSSADQDNIGGKAASVAGADGDVIWVKIFGGERSTV